ncbi:hypothetical protein IQ07DRAFT_600062 [Pyrenochaeta sp. DS3sAY3a]|nr:hypothetical protein IQ07DRAFT_600062 [Pyrenochaeta sp. DS3sAY3a]
MSYSPPYAPPISPLAPTSNVPKVVSIAANGTALAQDIERLLPLLSVYVEKGKLKTKKIRRLATKLQKVQTTIATIDHLTLGASSELDEELQKLKLQIEQLFCRLEEDQVRYSQKLVQKFSRPTWPYDLDESERLFDTMSSHIWDISHFFDIETGIIRSIESIPRATEAAITELDARNPNCLQGTRTQLLAEISHWKTDPGSPTIYWLYGEAGTGKSTIARTFGAAIAKNKNEVLLSFCFSRAIRYLAWSTWVLTTVAAQLADASRWKHHILGREIGRAVHEDPQLPRKPIEEQWRRLLLEPLTVMDKELQEQFCITIVLDALDECIDGEDIQLILELLSRMKGFQKIQFRVFTTSRPAPYLLSTFNKMPQEDLRSFSLHQVPTRVMYEDIFSFVKYEMSSSRSDGCLEKASPNCEDRLKLLASQASGSFIYASTACRFIRYNSHVTPSDSLDLVLGSGRDVEPAKRLDKLYDVVLTHLTPPDSTDAVIKQLADKFRQYIGPLIIMVDTLPRHSYLQLVGTTDDSEDPITKMLIDLRSVLEASEDPTTPIRLLHSSFRDFLLDDTRVPKKFSINQSETHYGLTDRCLSFMESGLRYNIFDLEPDSPRPEILQGDFNKAVSPALQYACRSDRKIPPRAFPPVARGLQLDRKIVRGGGNSQGIEIFHFSKRNSTSGPPEIIIYIGFHRAIDLSNTDALQQDKTNSSVHATLDGAISYFGKYGKVIEKAPLQAYYCASAYEPKASFTEKNLANHTQLPIRGPPDLGNDCSPTPNVRRYPKCVRALTFSPDGMLLASASLDGYLKLWETRSSKLRHTLTVESNGIDSILFSPNSTLLASANSNCSIKLWNAVSGELQYTLEGHYDLVHALAWSPDSKLLASASFDRTVRTWDTALGKPQHTLEGHHGAVVTVAFSPDGKLIASASCNGSVMLWNAKTGKEEREIEGWPMGPGAIGFFPGGKYIALECVANNVEVYNVHSGKRVEEFEDHLSFKNAIAFLPDGPCMILNKTSLSAVDHVPGKSAGGTGSSLPDIVFVKDEWACIGERRVLWLLEKLQKAVVASHGTTLAFGLESGGVVIMGFGNESI